MRRIFLHLIVALLTFTSGIALQAEFGELNVAVSQKVGNPVAEEMTRAGLGLDPVNAARHDAVDRYYLGRCGTINPMKRTKEQLACRDEWVKARRAIDYPQD